MSQAVFQAIQKGDKQALLSILDREPGAGEAVNEQGISALMTALYYRQFELAEVLVGRREDVTFFEAGALGRIDEVVRKLDEDPGLLDQLSPDGFTVLHLAAFFGRTDLVGRLVERGASLDRPAENPSRVTPLHSAVAGRTPEIVEILVAAGADLEVRQQGGYTPLMGAAANGQKRMVRFLLDRGADPDVRSDEGKTARDLAVAKGHPGVI